MRIVILTAHTGGAHASLAKALAAQLDEGTSTIKISAIATAGTLSMLPKIYSYLVTRLPIVWALYYYGRKLRLFRAINRAIVRRALPPHIAIGEAGADLTIVTHPMYGNYIDDLKSVAGQVVVIPTDLFNGPMEWFAPNASLYVVASQQMRVRAARANIPLSRIIVRRLPTGLPVAATIKSAPQLSPPRILVMGGAEGVGPIRKVTSGLGNARCRPALTVACGNNLKLAASMRRDFPGIRILPFSPNLADTFQQYDLIVTKPGSLTLQEAADTGVPFLLMPGIPGLETSTGHICQRLGIPLIWDAHSASAVLNELIDHTGLPLPGWDDFISKYVHFRDMLPKKSFLLNDLPETL